VLRADSRHQPVGRHDHRRHDLRPVTATEFSFFLAIPTLIGAGVYDTWKYRALLSAEDIPLFAVGLVFAFVSALACVHWLIRWVAHHDFRGFAWYRIVFGLIVLAAGSFTQAFAVA
jgi:undecaprenyl pyrophosphate phosphatase UppP